MPPQQRRRRHIEVLPSLTVWLDENGKQKRANLFLAHAWRMAGLQASNPEVNLI